jgi:hypothetical protein
MTSVFSVLAAEDHAGKAKSRQALALAHKRVSDRFDSFLSQKTASDYNTRMDMIRDDFEAVVKQACSEVGYADHEGLTRTLWNERLVHATGPRLASADDIRMERESRRPKLCPYHSEVVDASLAAGKPDAGYAAMAQHAWGEKHCKGDGYEGGRCSFKPEMTTQSYWDQKKEDAEKRREERAEQQRLEQEQQTAEPTEVEETPQAVEEPVAEELPDNVVELPTAEGGEAEVQEGLTQDELMSVAASFQRFAPLSEYDKYFGGKPGAAAKAKAAMIEEYGEEKGEQVFYAKINKKRKEQGETKSHTAAGATAPSQDKLGPIERTEVDREGEGAVPEMNKRKWTPQAFDEPIDTEHPDSPHPTRRIDIQPDLDEEPARVENADARHPRELTQIGENTLEHQDVTKKSPYQGDKAHGSWN